MGLTPYCTLHLYVETDNRFNFAQFSFPLLILLVNAHGLFSCIIKFAHILNTLQYQGLKLVEYYTVKKMTSKQVSIY